MSTPPAINLDEDNNDVDAGKISDNEFGLYESKHQQALNIATVAQGWIVSMREHKYTHALLQDIDTHCANAMMLASKLEAFDYSGTQCEPEETCCAEEMHYGQQAGAEIDTHPCSADGCGQQLGRHPLGRSGDGLVNRRLRAQRILMTKPECAE